MIHTATADVQTLYTIGVALMTAGFLIIITAFLLFFLSSKASNEGKARYGGVILVGPFPIIFGKDKETVKMLLILSLALTISLIILMVIFHFMNKQ